MGRQRGWRNWAGNQAATPARHVAPRSDDALAATIAAATARGGQVRAVGTGHSFTSLVPTGDTLVDLRHLTGLHHLDPDTGDATFAAGTPLHRVSATLAEHGRALENLGDIAVQTLAGATQTGTHGTGARFANLSATITGMTLLDATGAEVTLGPHDPALRAARIGLGALGIATTITVRTVPAFTLRAQETIEHLDEVLADLDGFVDGHDHAELFWFPGSAHRGRDDLALVKRHERRDDPPQPRGRIERFVGDEVVGNLLYGALVRAVDVRPRSLTALHAVLRRLPASRYTERSDQVFASPRRVRFVEMELSVPRAAFGEALARLRARFARDDRPLPFPVECRFVAGDDADLSPAHGGDRAYLAVHLSPRAHDPAWFAAVAADLDDLGARPHWGKLHPWSAADLAPRYPRWDAFQAVRERLDPTGTFTNPHLAHVLGPVGHRAGHDAPLRDDRPASA